MRAAAPQATPRPAARPARSDAYLFEDDDDDEDVEVRVESELVVDDDVSVDEESVDEESVDDESDLRGARRRRRVVASTPRGDRVAAAG